jgi:hypothetical protein
MTKTHGSLRPAHNIALIVLWAAVVVAFLFASKPHLPTMLVVMGGGLGLVADLMQHMSVTEATDKFVAASSFLEVRRAFQATPWGKRYIWWLYFSKITLAAVALLLSKGSLVRILLGYLAAYASLMLVRELVTLRDTYRLSEILGEARSVNSR